MNYLEWIDQQINRHQTEIARLEIARGVVAEAGGNIKPEKKPKLLSKPKRTYRTHGDTRAKIIVVLKELGRPAEPKEINTLLQARHPELTDKAVWNALYNARIVGVLVREGGMYSLPEAPKQEVAA